MQHNRSLIRTLVVIITLTLSVGLFNSTAHAGAGGGATTCAPPILQAMKDRATAVSQRNVQVAQSLITRPDPTSAMVCLGSQFAAAAQLIGSIFTDNPQFAGSCAIGNMSGTMLDSIANTLIMVVSAGYALGGGTLSVSSSDITNMLTILAANAAAGPIGGAIGGLIGGCWGGLIGGLVTSAISSAFGGSVCDAMDAIWEGVALGNTRPEYFKTLRELQTSDPRTSVAGIPFTHALAGTLFSNATGISTTSLATAGAFAPANMNMNSWAPYSVTGTCTAIPTFGPFISCNKGCQVSGTFPVYTCVP